MNPGNLQGWFNWYMVSNESRIQLIREGPPQLPKIKLPTRALWESSGKVLKVEWADRLGDSFADCKFTSVPEAGHFVHYERPELANRQIAAFYFGSTNHRP